MALFLVLMMGGLVQSVVGFGVGTGPFLAVSRQVVVPAGLLVPGVILALVMMARDIRHVDCLELGRALFGRVPGILVGTLLVLVSPSHLIGILFSVSNLGAVVANWSQRRISLCPSSLVLGGGWDRWKDGGHLGTTAGHGLLGGRSPPEPGRH